MGTGTRELTWSGWRLPSTPRLLTSIVGNNGGGGGSGSGSCGGGSCTDDGVGAGVGNGEDGDDDPHSSSAHSAPGAPSVSICSACSAAAHLAAAISARRGCSARLGLAASAPYISSDSRNKSLSLLAIPCFWHMLAALSRKRGSLGTSLAASLKCSSASATWPSLLACRPALFAISASVWQ